MSENEDLVQEKLKTTSKQSGISFLGRIVIYFLGFLYNIFFARFFGASIVGVVSITLGITGILKIIPLFGLHQAFRKFIPMFEANQDEQGKIKLILFSLTVGITLSSLFAVVIFFFRNPIANYIFSDPNVAIGVKYLTWLIITTVLISLLEGLFRGFKNLIPPVASKTLRRALELFFIILLGLVGITNLASVTLALLASSVVAVIYFMKELKKEVEFSKFLRFFDKQEFWTRKFPLSEIFTYGLSMSLVSMSTLLIYRIDRVIAGFFVSSAEVGIYNIAARVATLASFVLASFNSIFASIISELYEKDNLSELASLYSTVTRWGLMLTLPIFFLFLMRGRELLSVFGPEFISGNVVLIILASGYLISTGVGANGFLLNMTGREWLYLGDAITLGSVNVVLNFLLIPRFGIEGAAIATGCSMAVYNILKVFQVKKLLGFHPFTREQIPVIMQVAIFIPSFFWQHLLPEGLIGIFFLLLYYVFGTVIALLVIKNPYDKFMTQTIINKMRSIKLLGFNK